ncbi:MAG: lipocalin-like domain-containing protein [Steroidobacteraceae bacterium]
MNHRLMRVSRARWPFLLFIVLTATPCVAAAPDSIRTPHATRQALIGAWRLLSIQIVGPSGPMIDPFYNADSTGILIYDASGWMSVQIVGQHRPAMAAAASRPTHDTAEAARLAPDTAEAARVKAAVLDTYYAYFGTWEFDESTSTVTHYIKSSLIPGESGISYSQTVTLDGGQLTFTTRRESAGGAAVQKKVWQRIAGPQR